MVDRRELTPEIVDALVPPSSGERWIADSVLKGFGVRMWANSKGNGFSYSIRIRDANGVIRRENFSVWKNRSASLKIQDLLSRNIWEFDWGMLLGDAREWARIRIGTLKRLPSVTERRECRRKKVSDAFQAMTLEAIAERTLEKMERQHHKDEYVDQVRKLFWKISENIRSKTMMNINAREIASDITHPDIPIMQSRTLQSFVGRLYSDLYRWHGPAGLLSNQITAQIRKIRSKQRVAHPRILKISQEDFEKFFYILESERVRWRESLAIRLYFETGAKMRRILRLEWSQIIDGTWYPYSPSEREYWFMGTERLSQSALAVLSLIKERQAEEDRRSIFAFPRVDSTRDQPITNVRRYWLRAAKDMGWEGLPISHVVRRHHERNTPSYLHMYLQLYVPMQRRVVGTEIVSKLANSAKNQ